MAASHEEAATSIVVALTGVEGASRLLRAALEEAQARGGNVVVLDFENTHDDPSLRSISANSHVSIVSVDTSESTLEHTVGYCESIGPGVLVLDAESIPDLDPRLARRVFSGRFDVLVVADDV